MKVTRSILALLIATAALALSFQAPAQIAPQAVTVIGPQTRDLGTLKTLTAATAATYTTADLSGYNVSRVVCVFTQSAHVGTPSTLLTIQNYDVASASYYDLITSAAITADATPTKIAAGDGVATTANVGAGIPIAKTWRVKAVVSSTTSTTAKIGCSVQ